jgi:TPR repeat protein
MNTNAEVPETEREPSSARSGHQRRTTPDFYPQPLPMCARCGPGRPALRPVALSNLVLLFSAVAIFGLLSATAQNRPVAPPEAWPDKLEARWSKTTPSELKNAAEAGNAEAQYSFGLREWEAAYNDNGRAFNWTLKAIASGVNATEEEKKSGQARWGNASEAEILKAAGSGDRSAQLFLGWSQTDRAFERGRKAFDWIKRAADQSLSFAEFEVGARYLGRNGWALIPYDINEGLKWERRSADHGCEPATHALAEIYLAGESVPPDLSQALQYLETAAALGCKRARYELARQYANGNGQPRNDGGSPVALLRQSAAANYAPAIHALAERYRTGLGVPLDYVRASQYYQSEQSADSDAEWDAHGQAGTILDLLDDRLEPKFPLAADFVNFAGVLSLYLKATERREAPAMNRLGELYLAARFVPKDSAEAYRWFDRAARAGLAPAAEARDKLKPTLTPEQLDQATKPLPNERPKGKVPE